MENLILLQALYEAIKLNQADNILDTSKTLSLCGVSDTVQNRVFLLANKQAQIEDIVGTIKEIYKEHHYIVFGGESNN